MDARWFEPVVSPAALAVGDVVRVQNCRTCGREHVHQLLEPLGDGSWFTNGTFHSEGRPTLNPRPAIVGGRLTRVRRDVIQE